MNLPNGHVLQNGKYRITSCNRSGRLWYNIQRRLVYGGEGIVRNRTDRGAYLHKKEYFKDYCYREAESFAVKVHSETGRVLFDKFKEKLIKEAKILFLKFTILI